MTPDSCPSSPFFIAVVVGAGFGGFVLTRVLQLHGGVTMSVFELGPISISRTGILLVVFPESGQYALKTAQLIA